MTEKTQKRIDLLSGPLVGVSWLMVLAVHAEPHFSCADVGEVMHNKSRILLLAVPGFSLGVMARPWMHRTFSWLGWAIIVWFCWRAWPVIHPLSSP